MTAIGVVNYIAMGIWGFLVGFLLSQAVIEIIGQHMAKTAMPLGIRPFGSIICLFREHDWRVRNRFHALREDQLWCKRCHDIKYVKQG